MSRIASSITPQRTRSPRPSSILRRAGAARPAGTLTLCILAAAVLATVGCGGDDELAAESWSVRIDESDRTCVRPDEALPLSIEAIDTDGRLISKPAYRVTADDPTALESTGKSAWIVRGEGPLTLTIRYTGRVADGASIAPVVLDLVRDGTAPRIVITSPARGAMLTSQSVVRVLGSVEDDLSPVSLLAVDGVVRTVPGDLLSQPIDVETDAEWGTNALTVLAADQCGNVARHAQAYLQSDAYLAATTAQSAGARLADAHQQKYTQEFIDDRDPADRDDVTQLAEEALELLVPPLLKSEGANATLYSNTLLNCDYLARITSAGPTFTGLDLATTLELDHTLHDIRVSNLRVPVYYSAVCRGLAGNVILNQSGTFIHSAASISTRIRVDYSVTPSHVPDLGANASATSVSGLGVDSSSNPALATVVDFVLPLAEATLSNLLSSAIEGAIEDQLPAVLDGVFVAAVDQAVTDIAIPPPIDLTLNAAADWSEITVSPEGIVQTLGHHVYPSVVGTPHPALGAINHDEGIAGIAARPGPVTFMLGDDAVNQVLWALWHGGGLELDDIVPYAAPFLDGVVDTTSASVALSALLPPVVMPSEDDDRWRVALGDLRIDATVDLDANADLPGTGVADIGGYVTLIGEAAPRFDEASHGVVLEGASVDGVVLVQIDELKVDGVDSADPELRAAAEAYVEGLVPDTLDALLASVFVRLPIPSPELALPPAVFGPDKSILFDLVDARRRTNAFAVDIDPDDPSTVIPPLANWAELGQVATLAARQEAGQWLSGASVPRLCSVERQFASRRAPALDSTAPITDDVKRALSAAGAPDLVARGWNDVFTRSFAAWRQGLLLDEGNWYPEFISDAPIFELRTSDGNTPAPLSFLHDAGNDAMSAAAIETKLRTELVNALDQPGAPEAFAAFAQDLAQRMDDQLVGSTVEDVGARGRYNPLFDYLADDPSLRGLLRVPESGPITGRCSGGRIEGNAFWP